MSAQLSDVRGRTMFYQTVVYGDRRELAAMWDRKELRREKTVSRSGRFSKLLEDAKIEVICKGHD